MSLLGNATMDLWWEPYLPTHLHASSDLVAQVLQVANDNFELIKDLNYGPAPGADISSEQLLRYSRMIFRRLQYILDYRFMHMLTGTTSEHKEAYEYFKEKVGLPVSGDIPADIRFECHWIPNLNPHQHLRLADYFDLDYPFSRANYPHQSLGLPDWFKEAVDFIQRRRAQNPPAKTLSRSNYYYGFPVTRTAHWDEHGELLYVSMTGRSLDQQVDTSTTYLNGQHDEEPDRPWPTPGQRPRLSADMQLIAIAQRGTPPPAVMSARADLLLKLNGCPDDMTHIVKLFVTWLAAEPRGSCPLCNHIQAANIWASILGCAISPIDKDLQRDSLQKVFEDCFGLRAGAPPVFGSNPLADVPHIPGHQQRLDAILCYLNSVIGQEIGKRLANDRTLRLVPPQNQVVRGGSQQSSGESANDRRILVSATRNAADDILKKILDWLYLDNCPFTDFDTPD